MKQQVIFINGAVPKENFENYYDFLRSREYDPYAEKLLNWNKTLWEYLWEDFEYIRTPSDRIGFADYEAWKIMFEKLLPFLEEGANVVTTSLGSTFIMKYIWENEFPVRIKKLFLIAPATNDTPSEKLGSFSFDIDLVYNKIQRWADQIYIYHSRDDELVPFEQSLELKTYFPEAIFREFSDRGHFYKEERLLELEQDLRH